MAAGYKIEPHYLDGSWTLYRNFGGLAWEAIGHYEAKEAALAELRICIAEKENTQYFDLEGNKINDQS